MRTQAVRIFCRKTDKIGNKTATIAQSLDFHVQKLCAAPLRRLVCKQAIARC